MVARDNYDDELRRLIGERDALASRIASLDTQLALAQAVRFEALLQRLTQLEVSATASGVRPLPGPSLPTEARPHPPRIVGQAVAGAALAMGLSPNPGATCVGWIPPGTQVAVTDDSTADQTCVIYLGRPAWVQTRGLERLTEQPPLPQQPLAPAAGAQPVPVAAATPGTSVGLRAPAPPRPPVPPRPPGSPGPAAAVPPQASPVSPPTVRLAPVGVPGPVRHERPPVWRRPGFTSNVLALVGAGVTLIGITFLLVLAAQYGFFGPEARTISAAALAVALVVLAFVVRGRDPRNVGAPILAATGVAAGFLSVVTATVIYGWLPPVAGVALAGGIGLGGMVLAKLWRNQWVALTAVLGSLVLAMFVGSPDPVVTTGLMVVLTGVTLWVERGTGWRLFPFARVLPTVLALLSLTVVGEPIVGGQGVWVVVLAVALALLGLASGLIAAPEPPVGQVIALGLLVPMVAPAALAPALLGDHLVAAAVLGGLAVAFVVTGFLPVVHERVRWATVPVGACFAALAVLTATEQRFWGVLAFCLATVYLAVAARTKSVVNLIVGASLGVVGVFGWLPLLAYAFSPELAAEAGWEQLAQSLSGVAAVVVATLAAARWIHPRPAPIYLPWAAAITIGSVAVVHACTMVGSASGNPGAGFQAGQAIVTTAWMALCVLFLHRGLTAKGRADSWLRLALVIAALAVAKLFLLDLGMLDAIARVGAFLAVGLLLLFVGTRYAKAWERAHGGASADHTSAPVLPPVPPAPGAPVPPPSAAPVGRVQDDGNLHAGERPITFDPPPPVSMSQRPPDRS